MMYLLDTNILSELRKVKAGKADRRVVTWARSIPADSMFLSVISILEMEMGVSLMERRDPRQGAVLRLWMECHVLPTFASRILAIDTPVALRCATLHVPNPCSYRDSLIASTAMVHGMTVVTRNVSDFEPTGVALLNPWQG